MVGYACMMHKCFLDTNLGSPVIKLMRKGFNLFFFSFLFFSFLFFSFLFFSFLFFSFLFFSFLFFSFLFFSFLFFSDHTSMSQELCRLSGWQSSQLGAVES